MVKEAVSPTPWARNFSQLFALIIGINQYESPEIPPLRSAVRDAMRYNKYLTDYLGVPTSQISMLLEKDASRDAIIEALKSLGNDKRINYGDPIFIVYAGHGSEDDPPPDWESGALLPRIQVLVPQDYCATPGLEVPYIPDRTIGALLEDIARGKGNNITMVMDCCHSASGTRGANKLDLRPRFVSLKLRHLLVNPFVDRSLKSRPSVPAPLPVSRSEGLHSHILIAACSSSEIALESESYGQFSHAFLKLLHSTPPDELRYSQILNSMKPIQSQNPQIEGFNLDRFLFGAEPRHPGLPPAVCHRVAYDQESKSYFIEVGKAHGITESSKFDMVDTNTTAIGKLAVKKVLPYHTVVEFTDPTFLISSPNMLSTISVQSQNNTHPYQVRLYLSPSGKNQTSRKHICSLVQDGRHSINVCLVDHQDQADLEASVGKNTLKFSLVEKTAVQHGFRHQFPRIGVLDTEKIVSFLNSTSRYLWELYRTSDDSDSTLMDDVNVSFYLLKEKPIAFTKSDIRMELMPVDDQDLCKNGEIDIDLGPYDHYGVKITNTSDRPLFPLVVYFDCRNLDRPTTYCELFNSGPYALDAPLKAGGCLTIGYGSGGIAPLEFSLEDGYDLTVGYLKLFIFTRPLHGFRTSRIPISETEHTSAWGTRVIPVIQRRRPRSTSPHSNQVQAGRVGLMSIMRTSSLPNGA